ncbi:hypothetical protein QAD02_006029 [Eretmocerus hayati]|uniref:Uncharacterized protein n=1 Tax=Eretmocerus hayati TaxID=131215 RepID=A0ACC2N016_9HYME|nr:hypothetical protein QAD02_006029 [Eretmocerus hayati]
MQEFCPECQKNGLRTRVKAFQINFEEAVFMCSSEKCIWPAKCQDLTCINRPVGKDWSKNWDELDLKYLKHDPLMELSTYTPPQTPGTDVMCKDPPVSVVAISVQASDKDGNSNPIVLTNKGVNSKEIFKMLNKSKDLLLNGTNSLKPKKELILRPVLRKLSIPSHVFSKDEVNGNKIFKVENNVDASKITQVKMVVSTSVSNMTSNSIVKVNAPSVKVSPVASKPLAVSVSTAHSITNTAIKVSAPSIKPNPVEDKPQVGLKKLGKRKAALALEEFDFDSIKAKSTNVDKKCDLPLIDVSKVKTEIKGLNNESGNVRTNVIIKSERKNDTLVNMMKPVEEVKKVELLPVNKLERDELLPMNDLHLDSKDVKSGILNRANSSNSTDANQALLDSAEFLTNDPEFDEDILTIMENDDTDLNLEELLAGFSDEISPAVKSEVTNPEDAWINDLFN